jgi:ribonuclease P protein component
MSLSQLTKLNKKDVAELYRSRFSVFDYEFSKVRVALSKFESAKMLIVTSKKVGIAVYRNYLRRVCKNVYRAYEAFLRKYSLVISFKYIKRKLVYKDIDFLFSNLVDKLSKF